MPTAPPGRSSPASEKHSPRMTAAPIHRPQQHDPNLQTSACMDYHFYLFHPGTPHREAILAPTLNFVPGRGLRFAIGLDNEPLTALDAWPATRRTRQRPARLGEGRSATGFAGSPPPSPSTSPASTPSTSAWSIPLKPSNVSSCAPNHYVRHLPASPRRKKATSALPRASAYPTPPQVPPSPPFPKCPRTQGLALSRVFGCHPSPQAEDPLLSFLYLCFCLCLCLCFCLCRCFSCCHSAAQRRNLLLLLSFCFCRCHCRCCCF